MNQLPNKLSVARQVPSSYLTADSLRHMGQCSSSPEPVEPSLQLRGGQRASDLDGNRPLKDVFF